APRPSTIPLVSVVLPAPSSPINRTTALLGSIRASCWPRATVSASECVSNRWADFIHRRRQEVQEIGGEHRFFAPAFSPQFPAAAVQPDCGEYCALPLFRMLCHQPGYHARQNIARAAGCHRRRPGWIDPGFAIREGDRRTIPFEHHRGTACGG